MIVAHISDTHISLDSVDAAQRRSDFERTIVDINALNPQPDVVFHTGDIVHNGRADEYTVAAAILAKLKAPLYVIPGNKDERGSLRVAFSEAKYLSSGSDFIDYTVEDFPVRLIALDTLVTSNNKGDFCRSRIKSLATWIDAETTKPVAVFCHHPPFAVPVGPVPINFVRHEIVDELEAVLRRSGRVVGIFSGHVHRATEGRAGDIPGIVVPCIATGLRYGDYPTELRTSPIYYVHHFDRHGKFSTRERVVDTKT